MNTALTRWLLGVERIPADAEGVRLAWEHPAPGWVWLLLIIAVAAFAAWSYSRLVGDRRGRAVLAAVRTGLILIVLVILAGPMLLMPRWTEERDWVIVVVDRSESMQIADADAGDARRRISRDEQLRRMISDTKSTWQTLDDERHLLWLGFHDGVFELSGSQPGEAAPPRDLDAAIDGPVDFGEAAGRRTNINAALEQALQKAAARPISGVILFSDGRTPDPPTRSLLRRLQAEQVPIFTVALGSDEPIGDLAVRRVDAPRRAFVGDKVPVVVELDRFGDAAAEMGATVRLIDADTGARLDEIQVRPGDSRSSITLTAEPQDAGEANWRVEIDTARADLIPENNTRLFNIELIDRPLRVLYIDGYSRWEYQYLRWMLIREKSIESSIVLLSADRDFAQEGNIPITRLPRSPEEYAQYDVIILGDVPASFFSPSQLEMMRDYVAERGAGLLWIGGERSLPQSYGPMSAALADLLPFRPPYNLSRIDRPVNMVPTALAERLGVLRLLSAGEVGWPVELADPTYRWSQLQWAQRIPPRQLKPTAQPLATTLALSGEDELPLVISMQYGAGQTIYVATDEIWRWRYGRGDFLPDQFWVQMIRMLGRETLAASDDPVRLEVEPRRSEVGRPVQIALRLLDARLADFDLRSVGATIEDAAGSSLARLELRRADDGAGEFSTTWLPDVVGLLRVRVDDPTLLAQPLIAEVEVFNPENELRRPETDHALLAHLAAETGGQALRAADIERLPGELLRNRLLRTPNPITERIWDSPLFFILVLLLLAGEWVGRKMLRLA